MHKRAVIMAGGKGTRLLPYTESTPKPMLEINGKPMLERIIERYEYMGFDEIWVAVLHHKEQIKGYFKDRVSYLEEGEAMGTGGALSLLRERQGITVVQNGDVLCNVNINAIVSDHIERECIATICAYEYVHSIPYGVIGSMDGYVTRLTEKPKIKKLVNTGIYALSEAAFDFINGPCTMPEIIERAQVHNYKINLFQAHNIFWLDVGTPEKYKKAQQIIR